MSRRHFTASEALEEFITEEAGIASEDDDDHISLDEEANSEDESESEDDYAFFNNVSESTDSEIDNSFSNNSPHNTSNLRNDFSTHTAIENISTYITVKLQLESHLKMGHLKPHGESNCNMMMFYN